MAVSNKYIYNLFCAGYEIFSNRLSESVLTHNNEIITEGVVTSTDATLSFRNRTMEIPTGEIIHDNSPFLHTSVLKGSADVTAKVIIPGESPVKIHYHGGEHSGLELQRGRAHIKLPIPKASKYKGFVKEFFLQNMSEKEALAYIREVRSNSRTQSH